MNDITKEEILSYGGIFGGLAVSLILTGVALKWQRNFFKDISAIRAVLEK